jgi:hypothetical protein
VSVRAGSRLCRQPASVGKIYQQPLEALDRRFQVEDAMLEHRDPLGLLAFTLGRRVAEDGGQGVVGGSGVCHGCRFWALTRPEFYQSFRNTPPAGAVARLFGQATAPKSGYQIDRTRIPCCLTITRRQAVGLTGMMVALITSHLSWHLREKLAKEDHTADQTDPDQARRPWWRRLIGR